MNASGHHYFIINKPTNMVSQFVSSHQVGLLGDLDFEFPEGTHAIGRLDKDSEGLLILTTNKKVTKLLFQGTVPHKRTYLVLVKNKVSQETLRILREGVTIPVTGNSMYTTAACEVELIDKPELFLHSDPNVPAYIPVSWLLISLTEGKFHQVRKMVSAVGHKCKRLIRVAIEDLELETLESGGVKELVEEDFFKRLKIDSF
jgi:23S rRNA pseudouridine2457 synthase